MLFSLRTEHEALRFMCPFSLKVTEVNGELESTPETINDSPTTTVGSSSSNLMLTRTTRCSRPTNTSNSCTKPEPRLSPSRASRAHGPSDAAVERLA